MNEPTRYNADILRMLGAAQATSKRTLAQHAYFQKVLELFHRVVELTATEDATREQVRSEAKAALQVAADYITDTSQGTR